MPLSVEDAVSTVRGFFRDVAGGILDLVYPARCVVCGDVQPSYLCAACLEKIEFIEPPVCARCGLPVDEGPCPECRRIRFAFAGARAVGVYEGVLRDAIHALKYSCHAVVAGDLGRLLADYLLEHPNFTEGVSCVIPAPIHASRQRERGFNQSELLARAVAESLRAPLVTGVLRRIKATRPQVELPFEERVENVRGAFAVVDPAPIAAGRVLLIDDVLTTGSTAHEASSVLLEAGAAKVYVLTVARSC